MKTIANKLLAAALLGLAVTGYAHADEASRIAVEPTQGQPYDGRQENRATYPEPTARTATGGIARDARFAADALRANG